MSKNVVNLILYLCAVFCVTVIAIIPMLIKSNSSATTGIVPWNNSDNSNNFGNSGGSDNSGNNGNLENSDNDIFIFLPHQNSTFPNEITISINESFDLMDFTLTNVPEKISSVKTDSDIIKVDNIAPYNVIGILGGEAEIIIKVSLNGTITQYEFYVTVIASDPIPTNEYELVAKDLKNGYWQILLYMNGEQIDYDIAFLEYDATRATADTNYTFSIKGTEILTFRLLNLNISCILEP